MILTGIRFGRRKPRVLGVDIIKGLKGLKAVRQPGQRTILQDPLGYRGLISMPEMSLFVLLMQRFFWENLKGQSILGLLP